MSNIVTIIHGHKPMIYFILQLLLDANVSYANAIKNFDCIM